MDIFVHDFNHTFPAFFFLHLSGQCCSCKEVLRNQLSQRRRESISFTDGSRSKRRVEQTYLIKRKRWNDSLMHLLDAQLHSITWDFLCEVFQLRVGQEEVLQSQGRRRGWSQLDQVSDYSTSSGTGSGFWMPFGSALFMEPHLWNTSFLVFSVPLSIFPPPRRLVLSLCSNWRCSKGVWGQCLLKVRPRVRLTLTLPFRCIYYRM